MLKIIKRRKQRLSDGLDEENREYLNNLRKELRELEKRKDSINGIPQLKMVKR